MAWFCSSGDLGVQQLGGGVQMRILGSDSLFLLK